EAPEGALRGAGHQGLQNVHLVPEALQAQSHFVQTVEPGGIDGPSPRPQGGEGRAGRLDQLAPAAALAVRLRQFPEAAADALVFAPQLGGIQVREASPRLAGRSAELVSERALEEPDPVAAPAPRE